MNKIWSLLVHLSANQWVNTESFGVKKPIVFDEEQWNYILEESVRCGINTIVLDVGDGMVFDTHPEVSAEGAWPKERVRAEVNRCRDMGIALIPKLNFSTTHHQWLGEYSRMVSTDIYYKICADLIYETYEAFGKPEYFHLGMDEEDAQHVETHQLAVYRQGELYWHDLKLLTDMVKSLGATPWIWACPLFSEPDDYMKHLSPCDAILSPWYYNAFRKEHWTPVESRAEYVTYYNEGKYAEMGIKFVEEDPFLVNVRNVAVPLAQRGYKYIPCASVYNRCDFNHDDLLEYFRDNVSDSQILGYMSAPWVMTDGSEQSRLFYEETFRFFKAAKEKMYG